MKLKKGKIYHVEYIDHATCYPGWIPVEHVSNDELMCETVGFYVKETKNTIFLALNRNVQGEHSAHMQIAKATISKIRALK